MKKNIEITIKVSLKNFNFTFILEKLQKLGEICRNF